MRIVKVGRDPDATVFRGDCRYCYAGVEAERKEVKVEWDEREKGEFGRAQCPNCKSEMIFYPKIGT